MGDRVEQIVFYRRPGRRIRVEVETARRESARPGFRVTSAFSSTLIELTVSQPSCASPRLASTEPKYPAR